MSESFYRYIHYNNIYNSLASTYYYIHIQYTYNNINTDGGGIAIEMGKAIFPGAPLPMAAACGRGARRRGDVLKFGNVQD